MPPYYSRRTYVFPDNFPQRLKRFQEESGLSWSEIARRLETYRHTVWRWADGGLRPNHQHRKALVELADSLMRYTIPMPDDSPIPGRNAEEMALNGSVLSTVQNGGAEGTRTPDLNTASVALSRLSYSPTVGNSCWQLPAG